MHTLPDLDYSFDSLEPHIDKTTMEIHYGKHHQAYVNNLNDTLANFPDLQKLDLENLLKNTAIIPEEIRQKVINNGGGHFNHSLYWKYMSPKGSSVQGELKTDIDKVFGNFETFKEKLSGTALTHFGSGWGWLVNGSGGLEIISTPNQISPISEGKTPILGIDVWEHAYYLKYQNKRADYIQAWWNIVNWEYVSKKYEEIG